MTPGSGQCEAETSVLHPMELDSARRLHKCGADSSPNLWGGTQPCRHLGFGLGNMELRSRGARLTRRTMRSFVAAVLSRCVCGTCYSSDREAVLSLSKHTPKTFCVPGLLGAEDMGPRKSTPPNKRPKCFECML